MDHWQELVFIIVVTAVGFIFHCAMDHFTRIDW